MGTKYTDRQLDRLNVTQYCSDSQREDPNHILNLDDHESTGGKELEDLPVTSDFADIATVATLGKKISIL